MLSLISARSRRTQLLAGSFFWASKMSGEVTLSMIVTFKVAWRGSFHARRATTRKEFSLVNHAKLVRCVQHQNDRVWNRVIHTVEHITELSKYGNPRNPMFALRLGYVRPTQSHCWIVPLCSHCTTYLSLLFLQCLEGQQFAWSFRHAAQHIQQLSREVF